jgi:hypothetical protein
MIHTSYLMGITGKENRPPTHFPKDPQIFALCSMTCKNFCPVLLVSKNPRIGNPQKTTM